MIFSLRRLTMFLINFWVLCLILAISNRISCRTYSYYPGKYSKLFPHGLIKSPSKIFLEKKERDTKKPDHNGRLKIISVKPLIRIAKVFPRVPSVYLEPPTTQKYPQKSFNHSQSKSKQQNTFSDTPNENGSASQTHLNYARDHDPGSRDDVGEDLEGNVGLKEISNDDDRLDFHVHGHQGPDSYIFGFDTGKGDNRQFRLEEKHENGTVTGFYGYYDPRGKLRKVQYISQPSKGYNEEVIQGKLKIINSINNSPAEKVDRDEEETAGEAVKEEDVEEDEEEADETEVK